MQIKKLKYLLFRFFLCIFVKKNIMTRKELLKIGTTLEIEKLVKKLPNDMDLGKEVRKLISELNTKIEKLT